MSLSLQQKILADPALLDGATAALQVLARRHKTSPAFAQSRLRELHYTEGLGRLFARVLPEEYAAEVTRREGSKVAAAAAFFDVLGFPVNEGWLYETLEENDPLAFSIPILSMRPHICFNCMTYAAFPICFQLAHLFDRCSLESSYWNDRNETEEEEGWWKYLAEKHQLAPELKPNFREPVSLGKFAARLAMEEDLKDFYSVVEVTRYSTGSLFFDFEPETEEELDIQWSNASIHALRKEFELAQRIDKHLEHFDRWFETNSTGRISQVLRLFNAKEKRKPNGKKRTGRRVSAKGKTLARIL